MKKMFGLAWMTGLLLLLVGCGGGGGGDDSSHDSGAFSALRNIPLNQSIQLNIPTYDGTGQVVHPDVILRNGLFYMTITPYPWSNLEHENPSFYVSKDGLNFAPPANGVNPIVNHPPNGYNDDPDIVYNEATGEFFIYYNETPRGHDVQYLNLLRSGDGVNWKRQRLITYVIKRGDPFIVSPAIVKMAGHYFMFHVDIDTANTHWCKPKDPYKHYIRINVSPDGIHWDKNAEAGINIDYPAGFHPWHVNVFDGHDGRFYMLINGYNSSFCDNHHLYLAYSTGDMSTWHFIPKPIVRASRDHFDSQIIYRSAGLVDGDNLYVYYSYKRYDNRWFLNVTRLSLSQILSGK